MSARTRFDLLQSLFSKELRYSCEQNWLVKNACVCLFLCYKNGSNNKKIGTPADSLRTVQVLNGMQQKKGNEIKTEKIIKKKVSRRREQNPLYNRYRVTISTLRCFEQTLILREEKLEKSCRKKTKKKRNKIDEQMEMT